MQNIRQISKKPRISLIDAVRVRLDCDYAICQNAVKCSIHRQHQWFEYIGYRTYFLKADSVGFNFLSLTYANTWHDAILGVCINVCFSTPTVVFHRISCKSQVVLTEVQDH